MKKYELYDQNMLTKNIIIARGLDRKFSCKIGAMSLIGYMGLNLMYELPEKYVDYTSIENFIILFEAMIGASLGLAVFDGICIDLSKKRLKKLENSLKEKGININFNEAKLGSDNSTRDVVFPNEVFIDYVNDNEIIYYDEEAIMKYDITEEVNMCLMPKIKYYLRHKYNKKNKD